MALTPLPSPLEARIPGLPLVLAGPILRIVDADQVAVWIALKASRNITLRVFNAANQTVASGTAAAVRIGQNLSVALVIAHPPAGSSLSAGTTYYYDLSFDGSTTTLASPGILTAQGGASAMERYVAYQVPGRPLFPAFTIPPANINQLRIAHGSCRRPHSHDLDALRTLGILLTNTAHDPVARIHQFFMTGDQIYADDVADVLLRLIIDAGDTLLGAKELLPGMPAGTFASDLPPSRRLEVTGKMQPDPGSTKQDALTSDTPSHLIGFSEFVAMYLFCWSDVLWPPALPTFEQTYDLSQKRPSTTEWAVQTSAITAFRRTLHRVRKVLANIPTYMILDDHEVTDDWYLHRRWAFRVFDKPLGRRIIQNGLLAYAIFQAWGNTPARFSGTGAGAVILTELQGWVQDGLSPTSAHLTAIQGRLPVPTGRPNAAADDVALTHSPNELRFDYVISWPTHNVLALDTRTWRSFRRTDDMHVALLTQAGLDAQLGSLPPTIPNGTTIVLLPGPTWMPPAFESVLDTATITEGLSYETDGKLEGLGQDVFSYENVLSRLAYAPVASGQPREVRYVVLSGDVHMSLASRIQYWSTRRVGASAPEAATMVLANLTSSGFKNERGLTLSLHGIGFKLGSSPQEDVVRIVWDVTGNARALVVAEGQIRDEVGTVVDGQLWAFADQVAHMAVVRDRSSAVSGMVSARFHPAPGMPEPTRLSVLRFIPSALDRIGPADINQINQIPAGGTPEARRQRIIALLQTKKNAVDNVKNSAPGKEIVGKHNVGILTFGGFGTNAPVVTQELTWWRQDGGFLHARETDLVEIVADAVSRQVVSLAFEPKPALDKV